LEGCVPVTAFECELACLKPSLSEPVTCFTQYNFPDSNRYNIYCSSAAGMTI
jgi:hypothetical protein